MINHAIESLFIHLRSLNSTSYSSLSHAQDTARIAITHRDKAKQVLNHAEKRLAEAEQSVKVTKKNIADTVLALMKLGCSEFDIKMKWSEYSAHDIAEWSLYNGIE